MSERDFFALLSDQPTTNIPLDLEAHARQIARLLGSEDWGLVRQGLELFHALDEAGLARAVLCAVDESLEGLIETPKGMRIRVRAWEDEEEDVTYTAGEEKWEGYVVHGGKTPLTLEMTSASSGDLAWVLACLKENHWNSDVPLEWGQYDPVSGYCSDYFHLDKDGKVHNGEPEPSADNDNDVYSEVGGGMGEAVYKSSYGFNPESCWLRIDDSEVTGAKMRPVLAVLALIAGVDLDELPVIPADPTPYGR